MRIKSNIKKETSELLIDAESINLNWIFHDEDWIRVINRKQHREKVRQDLPLDVIDNWQEVTEEVNLIDNGEIEVNGETKTNDEWVYLYLDSNDYNWRNFSWQFSVCRESFFRELQFGFRYKDFYNRYRFRFENNRIFFDEVRKGTFYNNIASVKFPMELGVWYDVRIDIFGNNFKLYVDGNLKMNEYDFKNYFEEGSIALILWEDKEMYDIKCKFGPMHIYSLESIN